MKALLFVLFKLRYREWKEKVDTIDNEANDTFTFKMKDTFIFNKEKSYPLTGDELVTIPHPLMVVSIFSMMLSVLIFIRKEK